MVEKLNVSITFDVELSDIPTPDASDFITDESPPFPFPDHLFKDGFLAWIEAQRRLRRIILDDERLRQRYAGALLNEHTGGRLAAYLDGPDRVADILNEAAEKLPEVDRKALEIETILQRGDVILLEDVDCRFAGMKIAPVW